VPKAEAFSVTWTDLGWGSQAIGGLKPQTRSALEKITGGVVHTVEGAITLGTETAVAVSYTTRHSSQVSQPWQSDVPVWTPEDLCIRHPGGIAAAEFKSEWLFALISYRSLAIVLVATDVADMDAAIPTAMTSLTQARNGSRAIKISKKRGRSARNIWLSVSG